MRIHSHGCCFYNVVQVSIRKSWCWRLYISETITTTETTFVPSGSTTLAISKSENGTRISLTVSEIFDRKRKPLTQYFFILIKSFANYRSERLVEFTTSYRSAFENHDYNDSNISGTITTTETSFIPVGSVTPPVPYTENGTHISLTVSEIFDRKHIALNALFLYSYYYYSSSFFPPNSLATYLLLQEWSDPGNFDIISKLGIGWREFPILAGKFQLVNSLWGKTFPHYKHKRRGTTYLLREIPVKNRERWDRGSTHGKIVG